VRVILKLEAKVSVSQKEAYEKYYSSTNAWFYNKVPSLHDFNGIKHFCFSNLIGVKNEKIKEGKKYSVIFSFSNSDIAYKFVTSLELGEIITLGELKFSLFSTKFDKIDVNQGDILETPTIIVVEENLNNKNNKYKKKSIDYLKEPNKYLELLEKNILHKYNNLTKNNSKKFILNTNLFKNINISPITYNKNIKFDKGQNKGHFAIPIIRKKSSNSIIPFYGNKLRFTIGEINDKQKDILNTVIDSGFGIHNSYGMGFIIKKK